MVVAKIKNIILVIQSCRYFSRLQVTNKTMRESPIVRRPTQFKKTIQHKSFADTSIIVVSTNICIMF